MSRRREILVEKFRAVTGERVVRLHKLVSALDVQRDHIETRIELSREVHTLKGEAKLLGFVAISTALHEVEELLPLITDARPELATEAVQMIARGLDLVETARFAAPGDADMTAASDAFRHAAKPVIDRGPQRSYDTSRPIPTLPSSQMIPVITSIHDAPTRPVGAPRDTTPPLSPPPAGAAAAAAADIAPATLVTAPRRRSATARPPTTLAPAATAPAPAVTAPAHTFALAARERQGVRVPLDRLEKLADVAGHLAIAHDRHAAELAELNRLDDDARALLHRLQRLAGRTTRAIAAGGEHELETELRALCDAQEQLVRALHGNLRQLSGALDDQQTHVAEIEDDVRDLRLVPLARLFDQYPRAVREMARELGKRIELVVAGSNVELDHEVLERIEGPLVHLIRNAIDHGIEPPDERLARGKPELAKLRLLATQAGSTVVVAIEDDGRGIDPDAVLAAAKRHALMPGSATHIDLDTAIHLLFSPGFSTRETASEHSGRGVGLEMVKATVEAIGGAVALRSRLGISTRVELTIPVTLVRAPALVVEVGGEYYGLAQTHLYSVLRGPDVVAIDGADRAIRVDHEVVRLVALEDVLAIPRVAGADLGDRLVIVLADGHRRVAIEVDRIVSETHILQRDLPALVGDNRLASGTAIVDGGRLIVILNVAEVMRASVGNRLARAAEAPARPRRQVLVVDDSELTRDIIVDLVQRLGFAVVEAPDGRAALDRLAGTAVDLVITDLEMPVLDGFGLLGELRATAAYRQVPVIVCSTRGSDDDKRRAADLGADAYIVKSKFDEAELGRTLDRLLVRAPG